MSRFTRRRNWQGGPPLPLDGSGLQMFVTNKSTAAYRAQTARTAFVKAPTEETRDAYLAALMRAKLEGAFVNLEAAKRAADHILRNARGRKLP